MSTKKFRKRRKPKKGSEGKQALAMAKSNKKKLAYSVEAVSTDTEVTTISNATPVVMYFTPSGEGYKCKLTSCRLKGIIPHATTGIDWRVDVVLDRDPDGAAITPLLLYGDATPVITTFKNSNLKSRFKILRTEFGESAIGAVQPATVFDWYIPLGLIAETKVVNNFQQANIQKNAVYLVYWTTAGADQWTPSMTFRITAMDA